MAKTETTKDLERTIWKATRKRGVFCCFEVTIGFNQGKGREIVDYITVDTKDIWRCYEIKTSLADFNSRAKVTFIGHYNYYVVTPELFEKISSKVPSNIGVYVNGSCVKRPKKQKLGAEEKVLRSSMIRSLYREAEKQFTRNYRKGNKND